MPHNAHHLIRAGWYHDVENLDDCLSVNCNWANASNLLWCGPRLVDEANAAPGEVSTSHFLRRVAARAASTTSPRALAAAAAASLESCWAELPPADASVAPRPRPTSRDHES